MARSSISRCLPTRATRLDLVAGPLMSSSIADLIPAMAEQRQNDDQAVEERDIEAAQADADNAGLDEGHRERPGGAAHHRADAAPGRRAADTEASTGGR